MNKKPGDIKRVRLEIRKETLVHITRDMLELVAGGKTKQTYLGSQCFSGCDEMC